MRQQVRQDGQTLDMGPEGQGAKRTGDVPVGKVARVARTVYAVLAWAFAACVVVQVFLAGMAIFVDPLNWVRHVNFVHFFGELPILMLILAWIGRLPRGAGLLLGPVILWLLIGVQFATAEARSVVAALHPVNALLLAWYGMRLAQKAGAFWPPRMEAGS